MGHYNEDKIRNLDGKSWLLGGLIPVGAGEIRLAYSTYKADSDVAGASDPETKKWALGYVHNLSKRTALYATYAHLTNDGGSNQGLNNATTAVNSKSQGYDLGIRHSF